MKTPTLQERFKGCLLGLALGDAVGAPYEGGMTGMKIQDSSESILGYTDDTEMAIGVAESLANSKGLNLDDMAKRFAENYNPYRGYGYGTSAILQMVKSGIPWSDANRKVFKEGSFGNGAAMRATPLGLFFYKDSSALRDAVERTSSITHTHRLGKEGAVLIAFSVSLILLSKDEVKERDFLEELRLFTKIEEYLDKLSWIRRFLYENHSSAYMALKLGHSVLAHESVPASIYAFLKYGHDFRKTIEFCISLGGDTDTIASMAGALSGCLVGMNGLPDDWIKRLENEEKGREYIGILADKLYSSLPS